MLMKWLQKLSDLQLVTISLYLLENRSILRLMMNQKFKLRYFLNLLEILLIKKVPWHKFNQYTMDNSAKHYDCVNCKLKLGHVMYLFVINKKYRQFHINNDRMLKKDRKINKISLNLSLCINSRVVHIQSSLFRFSYSPLSVWMIKRGRAGGVNIVGGTGQGGGVKTRWYENKYRHVSVVSVVLKKTKYLCLLHRLLRNIIIEIINISNCLLWVLPFWSSWTRCYRSSSSSVPACSVL